MNILDELVEEHEKILYSLRKLTALADLADAGKAPDDAFVDVVLQFIRRFADACHHAKEEEVLFPAMADKGFPSDDGPIAVMLEEHDIGRELVRKIQLARSNWDKDPQALRDFSVHCRQFIDLLSNHISKENNILFPMARQHLSDHEAASLLVQAQQYETTVIPPSEKSELWKKLSEVLE